MPKLFEEDSEDKISIKTTNEYAKKYNDWRRKEELNKLQAKYGEAVDISSDSSSSEDEDIDELNNEFEIEFLKTLSCLKTKDPCIYDSNKSFFENVDIAPQSSSKTKEKPMFLKDYERKIIVENSGQLSDEENENLKIKSLTYSEEQEKLKNELKNALENIPQEDKQVGEDWGGLLKHRKKTEEEKINEEEEYKQWLAGQKKKLSDSSIEKQLKPLKDFWSNPNLDNDEKFLRDYILKDGFKEGINGDYIPTYEEIVHDSDEDLSEDENEINKQEEFEHKYNFRFEEPDPEFIKRYPRVMENSLRKKDDKRKTKRLEVKERKKKEKLQKMEEIKQLKAMKKKEIEEKIQMLKEITGNNEIGFSTEDIEADFNPKEYDERMQSLFNSDFYSGPEEEQKPQFPDIDREMDLEIENWDRWQGGNDEENIDEENNFETHCEDDDFIMDCDYDPSKKVKEENDIEGKSRKKRKRKSKFAKAVSQPKPIFDPNDKSFAEYIDEYYKLDCEDIIGDLPCRFKYRQVFPNNFGLTTEEILLANDKELNRWCSLKKAVQYRPDNVEKYDKIIYERKAKDENLKKKILPSLYKNIDENSQDEVQLKKTESKKRKVEETDQDPSETKTDDDKPSIKKRKSKKAKKDKDNNKTDQINIEKEKVEEKTQKKKKSKQLENLNKGKKVNENKNKRNLVNKNKKQNSKMKKDKSLSIKKGINTEPSNDLLKISDLRLQAYGLNPKKFRNKLKYKKND